MRRRVYFWGYGDAAEPDRPVVDENVGCVGLDRERDPDASGEAEIFQCQPRNV